MTVNRRRNVKMSAVPLEARIAHLEGIVEQVGERLNGIDRRLETMDSKFENRFNWLIGIVVGTWATTILTVLFHHG
jgi:CII-binding regulator of phage lambda lysogenization HflD